MLSLARVTRALGLRSGLALLGVAMAGSAATASASEAASCEGASSGARVLTRVTGMASAKGNITVTLYPDDKDRFLASRGKLARRRVPVALPMTEACFAVPPGRYAIAVYHDANDDHDFNRKLTGLPAEGYGFSNNPVTRFGLPPLKDVRFEAAAGEQPVYIKLSY